MKRFLAIAASILLICALLCACGKDSVKTTVSSKYDDGYAAKYASSTSKDSDGNTVYEFSSDEYQNYLNNHKNSLGADIQSDIADLHTSTNDERVPYGEFAYINDEKKAVIVGVHEEEYDEAVAKEESVIAAEYGFKYFQNLEKPVDSIKVIYCNCNNQEEVYGTFDFTAE